MADISTLTTQSSTVNSLGNIILVTPLKEVGITPQLKNLSTSVSSLLSSATNLFSPGSFLFHYEAENTVTLDSDITDHVVEDNSSIQDQISIKPETITTAGFIGELNDIVPSILAPVKAAADKLVTLSPFVPTVSISALEAYNATAQAAATAASVANSAIQTWSSFAGPTKNSDGLILPGLQTKQSSAFSMFYGYWKARNLFTVQTPWAIFDDMAIKSLRAIQDEETRVISSFEITFKKIRYAKTILIKPSKLAQGRRGAQSKLIAQNGTQTPTPGQSLGIGMGGLA